MNLTWRFVTQLPHGRFIAVVIEDGNGFSAKIEGEIIARPQAGHSRIRDHTIKDQHYGPESVRARSLEALRCTVEEKLENDVGPVSKWTADPG